MSVYAPREWFDSVRTARVEAVQQFGFTERQARFLVYVLVHSGVFIERQYCRFAGIAHGHNAREFAARLVDRGYAHAITPGALHRGRLFHVQYKPLYEAIGEPDNRNRKPASTGRYVERLMLLDAVLADRRHGWLGTERDKVAYFNLELREYQKFLPESYPHLTFGEGDNQTRRLFPEKLPIGTPVHDAWRHMFLYLVTSPVPSEFRLFLLRHADLLRFLHQWTIRILVPRRFRSAAALYRYAVRDAYTLGLSLHEEEQLDWYFRARRGDAVEAAPWPGMTVASAAEQFKAARFKALHREWLREGRAAFGKASSTSIRDKMERGDGRVEFAEIPHQYLQLTPLVGTA